MEYTITQLAKLSHVTTRTLRYYDAIGLLKPIKKIEGNVRVYGEKEVDQLQQIFFFKTFLVPLKEIKRIMLHQDYKEVLILEEHLRKLQIQVTQMTQLMNTLTQTIAYKKGEVTMKNEEKFKGLKQKMLQENEEKYGEEIRQKYGEERVNQSNERFMKQSKEAYQKASELATAINDQLKQALLTKDPYGSLAQGVAKMHQEWISLYWNEYSKEAHANLVEMYGADERFKTYYESVAPGATEFLRDAVIYYLYQTK